ncbi:hypothetical protein EDD52_13016 [Primorskyibacter sedentarius]|uniref:Uncharacterized protein n=2 Tax=Primorskyibacter sedentarius TaxID=745311 RepID=A0A4V2UM95_9RHOB|nr:hypothetical protein EDD52_13016 [Primorskyibacter sedentarius]
MRLFARTPMTGAALRIANTLAGYISYDGVFRGAPKGFAAFTMKELQAMTDLSDRTIRAALDELSHLFGLTIQRRHHARHLFAFTKIYDPHQDVPEAEDSVASEQAVIPAKTRVTGTPVPPSLYRRTNRNNDTLSTIQISEGAGSVYQTPFATVIETAKKGTEAESMDTQFLWTGFHMLNTRNSHAYAPLSWLIAFVRKAKPKFQTAEKPHRKPEAPAPACTDPVILMARPAPYANKDFHEQDLRRAIGNDAYDGRVSEIRKTYGASQFAAKLAVHGQAVKDGTIRP